jgi:hypothetical protein
MKLGSKVQEMAGWQGWGWLGGGSSHCTSCSRRRGQVPAEEEGRHPTRERTRNRNRNESDLKTMWKMNSKPIPIGAISQSHIAPSTQQG